MIPGLIFDVDGVLVDTVPLHFAAWKRMFTERDFEFDEALYRSHVDGKSRLDGVRAIMGDTSEDEIAEAAAAKQGYYLETLETSDIIAFADAARIVSRSSRQGLPLAAASSSRNAPLVLEKIGMAEAMDTIVTGADISRGKPDPEIFVTAAAQLGLSPRECLVFEDAEAGVEAANRGGFISVGVARGENARYLKAADLVVQSLDDVTSAEIHRLIDRSR